MAGERLFADLLAQPRALHRALEAITETTKRFALASLRAGADAIFFATQMATSKYFNLEEFREFGEPYDLEVLKAIRAVKPDFILLHIHGVNIYFDALAKYPVDVLNWHDRRTAPSLQNAREILRSNKIDRALLGGLEERGTVAVKSREELSRKRAMRLRRRTGGGLFWVRGAS